MEKRNILIAGVASLVVMAAVTYLVIRKRAEGRRKPPANAPQLDVHNPGDQSDFPVGPSGAPELG